MSWYSTAVVEKHLKTKSFPNTYITNSKEHGLLMLPVVGVLGVVKVLLAPFTGCLMLIGISSAIPLESPKQNSV